MGVYLDLKSLNKKIEGKNICKLVLILARRGRPIHFVACNFSKGLKPNYLLLLDF